MSGMSDEVSYNVAGCLRAASIGIALYDGLETLPSAVRLYREQWNAPRILISPVLLFLLQISSIVVLVVSNVGFFYSKFSDASCKHFYLWPSAFKVVQGMVSHLILAVRAFNLSRRSRRTGILLIALFLVASSLEGLTTLYSRQPIRDKLHGNCRSNFQVKFLGARTYYVVAIIYDLATTLFSVIFLQRNQAACANNSTLSKLTKMMLYDGVGYFIVLTAVNGFNLFLYTAARDDIRTAGASLGYCFTWIMSQRLLLHLHAASRERRNQSINEAVTISQNMTISRGRALRSQFEPKSELGELTIPDFEADTVESPSPRDSDSPDFEGRCEVRIERTVRWDPRVRDAYEMENYTRGGSMSQSHATGILKL